MMLALYLASYGICWYLIYNAERDDSIVYKTLDKLEEEYMRTFVVVLSFILPQLVFLIHLLYNKDGE